MPFDENLTYFHGVAPFTWSPNRLYRVYIRPGELVFVYAGSPGEVSVAAAAHFGLLGGLIAAAANPARKNQERQEKLNTSSLEELLDDHKHNFRASAEELSDVSLNPYAFWTAAIHSQPNHVGIFRFTHASKGKMMICINSSDDMRTAVEKLPAALGDRVELNGRWDDARQRFVKLD